MRAMQIALVATVVLMIVPPAAAVDPYRVPVENQPPVVRLVDTGASTWLSQPPNQVAGYFSDAGCDICNGVPQVAAENFVISTGGVGVNLEQAVIWGGYGPGDVPTTAPFEVIVHGDAGGLPGEVVCQDSVLPASDILTGVTAVGVSEHQITLELPSCSLVDGSWWIEIFTDTGLGTDDWFWETGAVDVTHGIGGAAAALQAPGVTWLASPYFDFAITLDGDLVPVELQTFDIE